MSVNIEGNVGQTSAASGWYQNGRVVSAQEKEKDAPQPKADNAVKVSISQEGIESYRKQTRKRDIGQGYQDGTRERYVEDENSETGFRKMTMEEELNRLDRAFHKMADRADAKEMIEGEFQRLRTERGKGLSQNASKKPQGTGGDAPETAGQKMKRLAQEWKDAYKASGSKENGMEKVMSLLNSMFHISSKA